MAGVLEFVRRLRHNEMHEDGRAYAPMGVLLLLLLPAMLNFLCKVELTNEKRSYIHLGAVIVLTACVFGVMALVTALLFTTTPARPKVDLTIDMRTKDATMQNHISEIYRLSSNTTGNTSAVVLAISRAVAHFLRSSATSPTT